MPERKFKLTEKQVGELWRAYAACSDGETKIRYQTVRLFLTARRFFERLARTHPAPPQGPFTPVM